MTNLFIKSTKFFFVLSIAFFLSALLIHNSWVPELIASLSVFHALSSVVFILIFLFFSLNRWAIGSVAFFATQVVFNVVVHLNSAPLIHSQIAKGEDEILRIAQYNVYYANPKIKDVVDWFEENHDRFDIIFLQEVSMDLQHELQRLNKHYPHHVYKQDEGWLGSAFFSKIPIRAHEIKFYGESRIHYLNAKLRTPKGKSVAFYGLHVLAPFSPNALDERNGQIREMSKILSCEVAEYKIMAGDFNMTAHSTAFAPMCEISGLKKPRIHSGSWPIFLPPPLRIQLDHLLVSNQIDFCSQEIGEDMGSDHLPVITTIVLKA